MVRCRRLWLLAVVLAAVLGGAAYHFTRPHRLARLISQAVSQITLADVSIQAAHLHWNGSLELHHIQVQVAGLDEQAGQLLEVERVAFRRGIMLLLGRLDQVGGVFAWRPRLHLTEHLPTGQMNLLTFLDQQQLRQRDQRKLTWTSLPELQVQQAQLVIGEQAAVGQSVVELERLELAGHLLGQSAFPGQYQFMLQRQGRDGPPLALHGQVDLPSWRVEARLQHLDLAHLGRHLLPSRYRQWWDRLDPEGALTGLRLSYDPADQGLLAEVVVGDFSLTLPVAGHPSRLAVDGGRFVMADDQVRVEGLVGQLDAFTFNLQGLVDGLDADAGFQVELQMEGPMERRPWALTGLPGGLQRQLDRYMLAGPARISVWLSREHPDARVAYRGQIDVLGGSGGFSPLPYPISNVTGQVTFDHRLIEFHHVQGVGPTGAKAQVTGQAGVRDHSLTDLRIRLTDVPIDHAVMTAIEREYGHIVDQFLHQPSWQRLVDAGLIQSAAARLTDDDAAPIFDLGGQMGLLVKVLPDADASGLTAHVELDVAGGTLLSVYWPYPVRLEQGRIAIAGHQVVVDDVRFRTLDGRGSGRAFGQIAFNPDAGLAPGKAGETNDESGKNPAAPGEASEGRIRPDLVIQAEDLPIDDLLLASLPQQPARWLRDLAVAGRVDAVGRVGYDDQGIDFTVDVELAAGQMRPHGGDFTIGDLAGQLIITDTGVTIQQLTGRHGPSELQAEGAIDWLNQQASTDLTMRGQGLDFSQPLMDLLPADSPIRQRWAQQVARYQPRGRFDVQVDYSQQAGRQPDYRVALQPRELGLQLDAGRMVELTSLGGQWVVDPQRLRFEDWTAGFNQGRLRLAGAVSLDGSGAVDLSMDAYSPEICETTQSLLPAAAGRLIEQLALRTDYELVGGRLTRPAAMANAPDQDEQASAGELAFSGQLTFSDAQATVGLEVQRFAGQVTLQVQQQPEQGLPAVDARIQAVSLLAGGRLLEDFSAQLVMQPSNPHPVVRIQDVTADCYEGMLVGQAEIRLDDPLTYRLALTLQDARLDSVIRPAQYPPFREPDLPQDQQVLQRQPTGVVSANLHMEGQVGLPQTRRGRGEMVIRDASMYELPMATAMLQLINLSLPTAGGFDRASATYVVDGEQVLYDTIRIEGGNLRIAGEGSMHYPTRELDLKLFTRHPDGPRMGLLGDLARVFKDELVSVEVTGTLDRPQARLRSFSGIRRSWDRIFGPPISDQPLP